MTDESRPPLGSICWTDLTVQDAAGLKEFYAEIANWKPVSLAMDGYDDYCMNTADGDKTVAGICHARGENAKLPPQWLIYITVADVQRSADRCVELGGEIVDGPRKLGDKLFCVIRDPAGAVAALING